MRTPRARVKPVLLPFVRVTSGARGNLWDATRTPVGSRVEYRTGGLRSGAPRAGLHLTASPAHRLKKEKRNLRADTSHAFRVGSTPLPLNWLTPFFRACTPECHFESNAKRGAAIWGWGRPRLVWLCSDLVRSIRESVAAPANGRIGDGRSWWTGFPPESSRYIDRVCRPTSRRRARRPGPSFPWARR